MRKILFLLFLLTATIVSADMMKPNPVKVFLHTSETTHKVGDIVELKLEVQIEKPWHIFSETPEIKGPIGTKVELESSDLYVVDHIAFPKPSPVYSEVFEKTLQFYVDEMSVSIFVKPSRAGDVPVKGVLKFQSCSDKVCMPPAKLEFSAVQKVL